MWVVSVCVSGQPSQGFYSIRATDKDVGLNAQIDYSLTDNAGDKFGIISTSGFLYLNSGLPPQTVSDNNNIVKPVK
jgi:hypothetical protein